MVPDCRHVVNLVNPKPKLALMGQRDNGLYNAQNS